MLVSIYYMTLKVIFAWQHKEFAIYSKTCVKPVKNDHSQKD